MAHPVEPRFLVHQATYDYLSEPLYFQLTQMNASCWVWVGKKNARLNDVSVGMPIPGQPTATTVFGQTVGEASRNIARRLAAKYNQPFYISLDLGNANDDMLLAFCEKKLSAFVKSVLT
ncbi:hypothetical protein BCR43DRAFT_331704 [Syncephalastrum racemosum]|uniref:Proteasome assembly chaperone 4 n=1 Tax=Syncephalastrum racemosum TaxID=13706 RepID=A0A1X2H892_SYNRA|nr:hypothetical protein BCR43DRAFT_331704 [Syncephalastrum racemosum]